MPKRFRSRGWTIFLTFFFGCETVFVIVGLYAILLHSPLGLLAVLALNVAFGVAFLRITRNVRRQMDYVFETDGESWIRRLGDATDIRITPDNLLSVARQRFAVTVRSSEGEITSSPTAMATRSSGT